ncbi:MAG: c-type cytochrome, partial [Aureliella sp.]
KNTNRLWRRHAQRLLVERGQSDVVPDLIKLVADQQHDEVGLNAGAIHALWTLKGLGALDSASSPAFAAATAALKHPSAGVRRNAALVLPSCRESVAALAEANLLADAEPQVRLGALMALAEMPEDDAAGKLLAAAARDESNMLDRWLREGIICAGAAQATPLLSSLLTQVSAAQSGEASPKAAKNDSQKPAENAFRRSEGAAAGGRAPARQFADVAEAQDEVVAVLAEHLARSSPTREQLVALLKNMAAGDQAMAEAIVAGLARGWPRDYKPELTGELEKELDALVEKLPLGSRGQLVMLASSWGSEKLQKYAAEIIAGLKEQIGNEELSAEQRLDAVKQLMQFSRGSDEVVVEVVEMLGPQNAPQFNSGIVRALAGSDSPRVGELLIENWNRFTPKLREDAVSVLLLRPESTRQLIDSLAKGPIGVSDLTLDQRQTLKNHPNRRLREAATKVLSASGGLPSADRVQVIERYTQAAHTSGDAKHGKELFKKNCANCHKHSGEGQEIGPDLTGMAVHPKEELLVHILDPSRSVEGNFRRYTVLTADGKVIAGMLAAESLSAIEIIDAEGKRQSISRDDVDQISATNKSLMPEGLEEQLKPADMTDLLEFLTSKGRFVPLPLAEVATAISTKGLFHEGDNGPDRMVFADWKPKAFNGVPFHLVDPLGQTKANIVLLYGPQGTLPPTMPRSVSLPVNMPVARLHLLSGVSGWGFPASREGSVSLIVRFHFADGKTEDQPLLNGQHFADYIRRIDVPQSQFAFNLRGQQIRYLTVAPDRKALVQEIELIKGSDNSAPIIMAITAEQPQ